MIIDIDEGHRIVSSELSWDIERWIVPKEGSKTDPHWKKIKYYATLPQALSGACQLEIARHPADTITDAAKAIESITGRYRELYEAFREPVRAG